MLILLAAAGLLAGCSISYSSGKSSDSISASLDSISGSSGSGKESSTALTAKTYTEDVAAATVLFASGQENSKQFLDTISQIARSHGIVNWEKEKETYSSMGMGLKRAGITKEEIPELPYFSTLAGTSSYSGVLQGYNRS